MRTGDRAQDVERQDAAPAVPGLLSARTAERLVAERGAAALTGEPRSAAGVPGGGLTRARRCCALPPAERSLALTAWLAGEAPGWRACRPPASIRHRLAGRPASTRSRLVELTQRGGGGGSARRCRWPLPGRRQRSLAADRGRPRSRPSPAPGRGPRLGPPVPPLGEHRCRSASAPLVPAPRWRPATAPTTSPSPPGCSRPSTARRRRHCAAPSRRWPSATRPCGPPSPLPPAAGAARARSPSRWRSSRWTAQPGGRRAARLAVRRGGRRPFDLAGRARCSASTSSSGGDGPVLLLAAHHLVARPLVARPGDGRPAALYAAASGEPDAALGPPPVSIPTPTSRPGRRTASPRRPGSGCGNGGGTG